MKNRLLKKVTAVLLSAAVLSSIPMNAFAAKITSQYTSSGSDLVLSVSPEGTDQYGIYELKNMKTGATYTKASELPVNSKIDNIASNAWTKIKYWGVDANETPTSAERTTYVAKSQIPKASLVSRNSTRVKLKWKKVYGSTGYYIYMSTGSGKFKKLAAVKGSATSYVTRSLKNYTRYRLYVQPYKKVMGKIYKAAKSDTSAITGWRLIKR